jgi:hypothetical protein
MLMAQQKTLTGSSRGLAAGGGRCGHAAIVTSALTTPSSGDTVAGIVDHFGLNMQQVSGVILSVKGR